jgi:hypothetical protein
MHSNSRQRKRRTPKGAYHREDRATPEGNDEGLSFGSAPSGNSLQTTGCGLMERILNPQGSH